MVTITAAALDPREIDYAVGLETNAGVNVVPPAPSAMTSITGVKQAAANVSGGHSLAVKEYGTLWAWGNNYYGQLGDGTTISKDAPQRISGHTGVSQVAANTEHSLALTNNGTVRAWGMNQYGECLALRNSCEARFCFSTLHIVQSGFGA